MTEQGGGSGGRKKNVRFKPSVSGRNNRRAQKRRMPAVINPTRIKWTGSKESDRKEVIAI